MKSVWVPYSDFVTLLALSLLINAFFKTSSRSKSLWSASRCSFRIFKDNNSYFNVAQVVSFLKVLLHKELVYYAITAYPSLKLSLKTELISKDLLHYSLPSLLMGRRLESFTWFLHKVRGLINHWVLLVCIMLQVRHKSRWWWWSTLRSVMKAACLCSPLSIA